MRHPIPDKPHLSWNTQKRRWELSGWLVGDRPRKDLYVFYGSLTQAIEFFGRIYAQSYR